MIINELMKNKKLTRYRLSKDSGIAYTTIDDICSGKARLEKCSAETIYRISKVLGVSMETLIEPCFDKRIDFELFKSNTCHKLKELGDVEFVIELLKEDRIRKYYKKKWYPESLYLLAMLDYASRENDIPICTQYDDLRKVKLKNILFPASILAAARVAKSDEIKRRSVREAIPEFMRFNIVESEVRDVV